MREILYVSQLFMGKMFVMREIYMLGGGEGETSVQAGDSLWMRESWQPRIAPNMKLFSVVRLQVILTL